MSIPTEPVGSVPRSPELQAAMAAHAAGELSSDALDELFDAAVADTLARFEATRSPVVSDGEQTKSSFATYPLEGMTSLSPDGVVIPFADGHERQLPVLTAGPFVYQNQAGPYVERAKRFTTLPVKQAVISASAMGLLYPQEGIAGYDQEQFIDDLVAQSAADIRSCFDAGADSVQVDFTEARLALKLDPSGAVLQQFIQLNNAVFSRFSTDERQRIGVHTCPGGDHDSTHSADVPYTDLIPAFMTLDCGRFFMQMASEADPSPALALVAEHLKPNQRVYVGVIDVCDEEIESAETVCDRVKAAAEHIPVAQLGTTDDCGFSPFSDDVVTSRDTAFAKIAARVEGTELAAEQLG
ncbi:MAG: 5-methyltetrahydropteroyltriglutamate--homocysteine methyltransferase [Acidimicrobiia bacterium]|nr:5-methyltetrahydropteroyltriglutamate--homocysteine methyltransferase [Acidimicrobiia bacterium]